MPKVNVHYTFTKDAFVDTIDHIRFQNKDARFWEDRAGAGLYKGVVKAIYVDNAIEVDVLVYGIINSEWSLEVKIKEVRRRPDGEYEEFGPDYKMDVSPVTAQVGVGGVCHYEKVHLIS